MRPSESLPVAPARKALAAYARARHLRLEDLGDVLHLDLEVALLVERRWLPWHIADQVAVALGRHPYELWPEWFDELDDIHANAPGQEATA